jgi:hypothetical protein
MNERIKELAEQAEILMGEDSYGKFAVVPGHEKDPISRQGKAESFDALEKFAELIVHQMLEITDAHTEVFQTDRDKAVIEHIKQSVKTHFGVEE